MSSLLDVPAQLALALSLAASAAGQQPPTAAAAAAPASHAETQLIFEPLEGPYRFGERNWLRTLKQDVDKSGSGYALRIFKTSGGRYYVPALQERQEILKARLDGALARRAAEAAAQRNARMLAAALRRQPGTGELYIAHVFGPEAAIHFIELARAKPGARAVQLFPKLVAAEPALARGVGDSLTLQQAYARITAPLSAYEPGAHAGMPAAAPQFTPPPQAASQTLARTSFVPGAIDWRPRVRSASAGTNQ